jgi:O-antigen/teichoic acid export membrane protein
MQAIEHRAARVSMVTGLSTVLAVGFQLVSVPVCLHFWGKDAYGSWLSLLSAFMLLRSLDGGYVVYVGNKLNELYHLDTDALRVHLSSAVCGIVLISLLQLGLAVGTVVFDPISMVLGMGAARAHGLTPQLGLLTLVLSWVTTGSYLGIVHRLLIPAGRMYQAAWWAMAFQICQFLSIMVAAILQLNMLQTSSLFAISQLFVYVASAFYVHRALPAFSPWVRVVDLRTGMLDLVRSLPLTASNMIQQGATNGVVLLVSALGGPGSVPVFTTVRTVTNLWTALTSVLSAPLLPEVVRMHAHGECDKLAGVNQAYWVTVGSAVNLGSLLAYPLIPILYARWTAHAVPLDSGLLCLLMGSVVMANTGALMAVHLNGINSLPVVLASSVARATLSLGLGALGYENLGLASFGVGIFVGEIVATLMMGRFFLKHEIAGKGVVLPRWAVAPITVSTGSVLVYYVGAALGAWSVGWAWGLTVLAVILSAAWGWRSLDIGLQGRLRRLLVPLSVG